MAKKLLDSKILYMALAVVLSVVLWFYVKTVQGEADTTTLKNIPVSFVGTDVLRDNGLMLTGEVPTVDLEVQANVSTLSKLTAQGLTLRVDVSRITGATEYTLSYDVIPPAGVSESSFTVVSRTPVNVTFNVARYDTVEIPIQVVLAEGSSIADGYVGQSFQLSRETVQVSGRADLVDRVRHALVTISGKEMTESIQETRTYQLIGADNQVLEGLEVTCYPETVEVAYEILKEVEVPLRVDFRSGGGATYERNVSFFDISPKTVMVLGQPEDLESLKELTVTTINLADVDGTQILTREIPLAEGLSISGGISTATITITVDGLEKRSFEVDRESLTLINVPDGFRADVRTQSLSVTIRGIPEVLEQVSPDNIRGTVDLSKVELASGQYAVPVKVQFDGVEGAGVLNGDYQVTVRLTRQ